MAAVWPARLSRTKNDHRQMCTFMRSQKELKRVKNKSTESQKIESRVVSALLTKSTKFSEVQILPSEFGSRPNKKQKQNNNGRQLIPSAQLRISFSGLNLRLQAKQDDIWAGTVKYTRKAVAKVYLDEQHNLLQKAKDAVAGGSFDFVIEHMKWDETQQQVSVPNYKRPISSLAADVPQHSALQESLAVCAASQALVQADSLEAAGAISPAPILPVMKQKKKNKNKKEDKKLTGLCPLRKKKCQGKRLRGTANVLAQKLAIHMVKIDNWARFEHCIPLVVPPRVLQRKSAEYLKVPRHF